MEHIKTVIDRIITQNPNAEIKVDLSIPEKRKCWRYHPVTGEYLGVTFGVLREDKTGWDYPQYTTIVKPPIVKDDEIALCKGYGWYITKKIVDN